MIRKENYVGGKRKYEFLKLYLIPERMREDKAKNEAALALAKAIQSKRIVEVQNDAQTSPKRPARLSGKHSQTIRRTGKYELCSYRVEYDS